MLASDTKKGNSVLCDASRRCTFNVAERGGRRKRKFATAKAKSGEGRRKVVADKEGGGSEKEEEKEEEEEGYKMTPAAEFSHRVFDGSQSWKHLKGRDRAVRKSIPTPDTHRHTW